MRSSTVTAVIVSFRSAALAAQALHSLAAERAATGLPDEVVMVDNDSGDAAPLQAAVEAAGYAGWAHVLHAPRNGGFGYGNNLGMANALSRGPVRYFLLLNPDTVVKSGAVVRLAEFLDTHPEAGIAGSSFENEDGTAWPIAFRFPSMWSEFESGVNWSVVTRLLARHVVAARMQPVVAQTDWVAGASMMIRADLAQQLEGFDEAYFLYFEETDLCLRARRLGFTTWYVPESRVMHIAGQSTKVTERNSTPRRLPRYWFESRRRYYQVSRGTAYAAWTDVVTVFALALGALKGALLRQGSQRPPGLARDVASNSVWWRPQRARPFAGGLGRAGSYSKHNLNTPPSGRADL